MSLLVILMWYPPVVVPFNNLQKHTGPVDYNLQKRFQTLIESTLSNTWYQTRHCICNNPASSVYCKPILGLLQSGPICVPLPSRDSRLLSHLQRRNRPWNIYIYRLRLGIKPRRPEITNQIFPYDCRQGIQLDIKSPKDNSTLLNQDRIYGPFRLQLIVCLDQIYSTRNRV